MNTVTTGPWKMAYYLFLSLICLTQFSIAQDAPTQVSAD